MSWCSGLPAMIESSRLPGGDGLLGEAVLGQGEPADPLDLLEQGEDARGVRHAGGVVGDLRPQAERRDADLGGVVLDRGLHAGGDVERAAQQPGRLGQLVGARRDRQQRGSGVRGGRRVGAEADDQADVQAEGEVDDGGGEGPPGVVGLGAEQDEQVVAGEVGRRAAARSPARSARC